MLYTCRAAPSRNPQGGLEPPLEVALPLLVGGQLARLSCALKDLGQAAVRLVDSRLGGASVEALGMVGSHVVVGKHLVVPYGVATPAVPCGVVVERGGTQAADGHTTRGHGSLDGNEVVAPFPT